MIFHAIADASRSPHLFKKISSISNLALSKSDIRVFTAKAKKGVKMFAPVYSAALLLFAACLTQMVAVRAANADIPSTFTFINETYTGIRMEEKVVVVAGGTSGIGFATAAMAVQECAKAVYIMGQNEAKGNFAAAIANAKTSQAHCSSPGKNIVRFLRVDVRNRTQIKSAFGQVMSAHKALNVLINTAGIAGWGLIGVDDIPENAFYGANDAIQNNLYGTIFLMTEAMNVWKMKDCVVPIGQGPCPQLGYWPSIVNVASEQALTPTPSMLMYGVSKAGIVQATRTVAAAFPQALRANVVAPGLVDTPLTWNQVRAWTMSNGKLNHTYPDLQFSFQCVKDGEYVFGDCKEGGKGSPGCPCDDVDINDPRVEQLFSSIPRVDPRKIAMTILYLASNDAAKVTGETYVVNEQIWTCPSLPGPPIKPGKCCGDSQFVSLP